jgi:chromosome partitioning protein
VVVLVIPNHKGGTGKTTTAKELAPAFAERGLRVLLVDFDPQSNLTEGYGLEEHEGPRIEDLLLEDGTPDLVAAAVNVGETMRSREESLASDALAIADRIWILPTSLWLLERRQEFEDQQDRLRELLQATGAAFDIVIVDPPPANCQPMHDIALAAGDAALIPVKPVDSDVMGAMKQAAFIDDVFHEVNPRLHVIGVLPIRAQRRRRLFRDTHSALEDANLPVIDSWVPEREGEIAHADRTSTPIFLTRPNSDVTAAYRGVASFVIERLDLPTTRSSA